MAENLISIGRSTIFFYRLCTDLIAECLVAPLTSALMSQNLWIPLVAAVVFQGLGAVMTLIIPETLPIPTSEVANNVPDNPTMAIGTAGTNDKPMFDTKLKRWNWQIRQSFGPITRDAAASVLVFTFFISKVGRQITNILLQYVSDRYDWSLSKARI